MTIKIGINGFGRIGRNVLRAAWDDPAVEFVHINDLTSAEMLAYLLENDSVHRHWKSVKAVDGGLSIEGRFIPVSAEKDPGKVGWGAAGVDIVMECTGLFVEGPKCQPHLDAGAKKVIISAPGKNIDGTFVCGVNDHLIDPDKHKIVSNASCTTNCLAPPAKVLNETVGIVNGLVTTVHAYTMDQNLLDAPHRKGDFRRARAAAINMVPTSTGAAAAIGLVLPELKGKLDGLAIRVPTPNVSLVDLVFTAARDTTVEEINAAFRAAAEGPLKGIMEANDGHLVSGDVCGNPHSSVVDLELTQVIDKRLVKILAWYDNEWGYSNRMTTLAKKLMGAG